MTFYTYDYLSNSQDMWQYVRLIVISGLILATIIFFGLYFRNRFEIKYKDLGVIFVTLLLLVLAIQYNDYLNIKSSEQQTGQITQTIKQVARKLETTPKEISVNSTTTGNNLIAKTPSGYYRIDYNNDGTEFVLEKLKLYKVNVKIQGVD
ncbi:DUF3290 domain-containing protein [Lentilactobacillus sp. Marseille-Q4993]|uniref:DUF3290 domain-containing protein n=1 Tax=Lentilactobacillus sp. Marseille-Q4993 TaxID=3039492 RepID=UPI0024BCF75E|nr:DUF3290 domain-containing protein [Lentilactobacillus sp. Marseille-Q4993]